MSFFLSVTFMMLVLSVNAIAYEMKLLTPVSGAQEYEFAVYPNGVEKIISSPGPFIDSKDLAIGDYEYKYRIRKNDKWSAWSGFSKIGVWKKPEALKKVKKRVKAPSNPLILKPFLFLTYRSIEAKKDGILKSGGEGAIRIGSSLSSKYYTSEALYETGKTLSRVDLGLMKIVSQKLQLGGRLMFASANFKDSKGSAKISSAHAFIQATGRHQTQNRFVFSFIGAGTIQGSLLASLTVSKNWIIKEKIKISPTLGYEYLGLKNSETRLNSASFLAGVFAELLF